MGNTNFQTIYPMGGIVNGMVKQATGREPVDTLDMDYVTVAQNTVVGELEFTGDVVQFETGRSVPIRKLDVSMEPIQNGSGDPSPENVRPISGWTGCNVVRTGKNLMPGFERYNNTNYISDVVFLKAGQEYTISFESDTIPSSIYLRKGSFSAEAEQYKYSSTTWTFTPLESRLYLFQFYKSGTNGWTGYTFSNVQLEIGSTATDYEPYTCTTITTEFPTPPGTVYGGTLDVITGVLTVDRVSDTFDGSSDEEWVKYGTPTSSWTRQSWRTNKLSYSKKQTSTAISDCLFNGAIIPSTTAEVHSDADDEITCRFTYYESKYFYLFTPLSLNYELADLRAMLASNPVQVVYPLAVPQTYQLTPQEVSTLVGDNTIYSDAGTVDVMYWVYREMS